MIFYIGDLHFGHSGIIKFDNRPFRNADEMDAALIKNWNERVSGEDTVYMLGDIWVKSGRNPDWYLSKLNGHKHLIIGNHDAKLLKNRKGMRYFESYQTITTIKDRDKKIVLCHYPLAEWDGIYKGYWHIYGHIHANKKAPGFALMSMQKKALNAGCMLNGYAPVTFDELLENNRRFFGWETPEAAKEEQERRNRPLFYTLK